MITRKIPVALTVVFLSSGLIAESAMAAVTVVEARTRPAQNAIVIPPGQKGIRPLYSSLCEYKSVMNNEDMRRCGVFLYSDPVPPVRVVYAPGVYSTAPVMYAPVEVVDAQMVRGDMRTIRRNR